MEDISDLNQTVLSVMTGKIWLGRVEQKESGVDGEEMT